MKTTRTIMVASASLVAAVAIATLAFAHTTPCGGKILDSPHRSWNSSPVAFSINNTVIPPGGGLTVTEVTNATTWGTLEWNDVQAGPVTVNEDNTEPRGFVDNGFNTISYEDPQNALGGATLAASLVGWYNSSTHTCTTPNLGSLTFNNYRDSDVVYNNGFKWTVPASQGSDSCKSGCQTQGGKYDIDGIAVQEVGHSIGLGHSNNVADSMYGALGKCDCTKQSATSCDVQAGSNLCY